MSSIRNHTWLVGAARIAALLLMSLAAGCQQPTVCLESLPDPTYSPSIAVSDLARRLGLEVRQANARYVMLSNPANTVVLPAEPGWVYVNGKPVFQAPGVSAYAGTVWASGSLADALPRYLAPLPRPVSPSRADPPRIAGGRRLPQGTHIVIDPGHGGRDPGAISVHGEHEKTINLAVARALESLLRNSGARVTLTRDRDVFIELDERAAIANRVGADLFVSLHADSARSRQARGCTVYASRDASAAAVQAATTVARAMSRAGLTTRGVRRADYRVLTRTRCPAILVEMGYLSNPVEARSLADRATQMRLAESMAEGLIGFLQARGL